MNTPGNNLPYKILSLLLINSVLVVHYDSKSNKMIIPY